MNGMNRAGRVMACKRVLMQQSRRKADSWMTTGQVAHRMGLKSSTRIKNMLFELALEQDGFMWRDDRGKMEFAFVMPIQMPLPERFIVINGESHKIANWVTPLGAI